MSHQDFEGWEEKPVKKNGEWVSPTKFWDDQGQRSQAHTICKNKALDYRDHDTRMLVREWLRLTVMERPGFPKAKGYLCDPARIAYIREVKEGKHPGHEVLNLDIAEIPESVVVSPEDRHIAERRIAIMNALQRSNNSNKNLLDLHGDTIVIKEERLEEKPYTGFHSELGFYDWYMHYVLNDENYDPPLPLGETHREWAALVESESRCLMLCPRDHFKTSFLIIGYALYCLCEQLWYPIVIISWDGLLSESTFGSIKGNLKYNKTILRDYGNLIDDRRSDTKDKFYTVFQPPGAKDAAMFCTSLKSGRITGTHPKMFMMDDIQDAPFAEAMMNSVKQIFNAKIVPAVGRGNKVVITGTIKGYSGKNDVYLWIKSKQIFNYHDYPAEKNHNMPPLEDCVVEDKWVQTVNQFGEPLFTTKGEPVMTRKPVIFVKDREKYHTIYPERYQIEDLVAKRLEMADDEDKGDAMFFSEYLLEASNPKGTVFPLSRIGTLPTIEYPNIASQVDFLTQFHHPITLWVDPGGKHGHGFAISVMSTFNRDIYILELAVVRQGIPEVAEVVYELINRYHIMYCMCEGNFEQKEAYNNQIEHYLLELCKARGDMGSFRPFNPINNKGDKLLRIKTIFTSMLGAKDAPLRVFVNPASTSIDQFYIEVKSYPNGVGSMKDFDLLDSLCSNYTHYHSKSSNPCAVSNKHHYRRM